MEALYKNIKMLVEYAIRAGLAKECDRTYLINSLLSVFGCSSYEDVECECGASLEEILARLCDIAVEAGLIEEDSTTYRDLFDTRLMGIVTPRPGEVISEFFRLHSISPEEATDYFYRLCRNCDYIREYRVKKDLKWTVPSEFGEIDITINLSKPEKDPKAIAAAKNAKASGYPMCLLCHENEGYAGHVSSPARQNLRQIPLTLAGQEWYLQYSPYVYYNEHCIALSACHTPMKIDRSTFVKLLDFVSFLPHYFLGSNADLPIVGGSILSHDHMQGGRYTFAMERAQIEIPVSFSGYDCVRAGIVKWPLSVIRLTSADKDALVALADKILTAWRGYTDEDAFIFAETDGEAHNTITPIARRRGEDFELDLVLRNNITTEENPLGEYHPHACYHNIKKENIGLIEVMGLAVLPARLMSEMKTLAALILEGKGAECDEATKKHSSWLASFCDKYTFTEENVDEILRREIGDTFVRVLCDAGVYKCTEKGRRDFMKFIESIG